jgi:hypothetical protein
METADVEAFVDYAQELEEETSGSGLAWLKAKRDEAAELITGTGSSSYISTTVDGQTFTRTVHLTPLQMFSVLQSAIRHFNGSPARIIWSEFSDIPH